MLKNVFFISLIFEHFFSLRRTWGKTDQKKMKMYIKFIKLELLIYSNYLQHLPFEQRIHILDNLLLTIEQFYH